MTTAIIDHYHSIDISDEAFGLALRFKYNGSRTVNIYQLSEDGSEEEIDIFSYGEKPDSIDEVIADCLEWFKDQITYEEIWRSA